MLNHVDAVCFFCYMVGSTFLGHAVQFFTCEPRVLFHCFVRSSVHDDAVGDHSIKEFCCIMFVRFFHPEVHLHFARSRICVHKLLKVIQMHVCIKVNSGIRGA